MLLLEGSVQEAIEAIARGGGGGLIEVVTALLLLT